MKTNLNPARIVEALFLAYSASVVLLNKDFVPLLPIVVLLEDQTGMERKLMLIVLKFLNDKCATGALDYRLVLEAAPIQDQEGSIMIDDVPRDRIMMRKRVRE